MVSLYPVWRYSLQNPLTCIADLIYILAQTYAFDLWGQPECCLLRCKTHASMQRSLK